MLGDFILPSRRRKALLRQKRPYCFITERSGNKQEAYESKGHSHTICYLKVLSRFIQLRQTDLIPSIATSNKVIVRIDYSCGTYFLERFDLQLNYR
jgi:hypothetical protein